MIGGNTNAFLPHDTLEIAYPDDDVADDATISKAISILNDETVESKIRLAVKFRTDEYVLKKYGIQMKKVDAYSKLMNETEFIRNIDKYVTVMA